MASLMMVAISKRTTEKRIQKNIEMMYSKMI